MSRRRAKPPRPLSRPREPRDPRSPVSLMIHGEPDGSFRFTQNRPSSAHERMLKVLIQIALHAPEPDGFGNFIAHHCAVGDCDPGAGKTHLALVDSLEGAPPDWPLPFTVSVCAGDEAGREAFGGRLRRALVFLAETPQAIRCAAGNHGPEAHRAPPGA